MSDEQDKLKLSLEPPKLFGRKKKSDAMGNSKSSSPASDDPASAVEEPTEEFEPVAESVPEPEPAPVPEPEPEPTPAPQKAAEPAPVRKAAPAVKTAATPGPPAQPAAKATYTAKNPARPRAKLAPEIEPEPLTRIEQEDEDAEIAAQGDEPPLLPLYPAAAVTGVVVGGALIVLIWLSLRGCEAVRGTSSCSGGPGFLLLVATFVVCVLLGGALLNVFSISDPGSTSFLGVGLVAVMALLFLIDVLDHWSMLIVIPLISVGAYLASVWVTRTFVEPGEP